MPNRLDKIITKNGDQGTSKLADGREILKQSTRIQGLGVIDELNSQIGVVRSLLTKKANNINEVLEDIQNSLFNLGSELALPDNKFITRECTQQLEHIAEKYNAQLPELANFILPGGSQAASQCHLARAVCRRAECILVKLHHEDEQNPELLKFINRLSDLLFILARSINQYDNHPEILWEQKISAQ